MLEKFNCFEKDEKDVRVRRYILPKKILRTEGDVAYAENLLSEKPCQISFSSKGVAVLSNGESEKNASLLLDFGAELAGSVKLFVHSVRSESKRAEVRIRFGESISEAITPIGVMNTTNDHANRDFTMDLGFFSANETPESGFRYLYIELLSPNTVITLKSVMGILRYRELEYKGYFRCNDELLCKIFDTAVYTVHLCMQEYLWDGVKRDRLVWIGDMHTEVKTILSIFGGCDVIQKSLDLIRDDTPVGEYMNRIPSYSLWWVIIHGELFRAMGDMEYLREQEEYLTGLVESILGYVGEDGSERTPENRFLDWQNNDDEEAKHAGIQGLLKITLDEAAELLSRLGHDETAKCCKEKAELMKKHLPATSSKQAAAMLALSGIGDARELDERVLSPGGANGYSTFFGYYILAAKALAGDHCGALNDIKEYWGGMLRKGATTFWEDFDIRWMENSTGIDEFPEEGKKDIHGDFGAYCYKNFRHSLCHGWSSGPCPYMMNYVLGIKALSKDTYEIKPELGYLEWAEGEYPTPYGNIKVRAWREGGETRSEIGLPEGIKLLK